MSFVRPMHRRKASLTILDKWQEYNRVALQVVWCIVVYIALVGLTGCSDNRPAVQEIQSEFESLGFHFKVWDLRDAARDFGFGCDEWPPSLIGTDGVNVGLASRLDIYLDIEDCDSSIEGADWDSVSLSFDDSLASWRNPPDYANRRGEYLITLISLLIPDMFDEVRQWIVANDYTDIGTYTRRFGSMTVEVKVESSYESGITFRPDKD